MEPKFPSLLFADSAQYSLCGKPVFCINGAYSVDKYVRLMQGWKWFESEELTDEEMAAALEKLKTRAESGEGEYAILSHTCPRRYEPIDIFLPGIDQSRVSKRMEDFLDRVEDLISYEHWYCGHWHIDRTAGKLRFMFHDIDEFKV